MQTTLRSLHKLGEACKKMAEESSKGSKNKIKDAVQKGKHAAENMKDQLQGSHD